MSDLKAKIIEKMKTHTLASFATVTEERKPWTRYVVISADEEMNIWFATFKGSRKVSQIATNPEVHLTLGVGDMQEAVDLAGDGAARAGGARRDDDVVHHRLGLGLDLRAERIDVSTTVGSAIGRSGAVQRGVAAVELLARRTEPVTPWRVPEVPLQVGLS